MTKSNADGRSGLLNSGPWDILNPHAPRDLVDFGAISFVPNPRVGVRAEVEDGTQRVVAISFDYKESVLQVQAFSSSKGGNLWEEVLKDIFESLESQNVNVEKFSGRFGMELQAELSLTNGSAQVVRLFGFNGDRWLLRGSISGAAITDLEQREELEDIFRGIVVRRGETPLPPREILTLTLPIGAIVTRAS